MQLSHVTAFWFRLAGNVLLDLFLYVHMFCSPVARTRLYESNPSPHCKGGRPRQLRSIEREGASQAIVAWWLFRIPKGLKCVERREAGRGAGVHAPRAEFTFGSYLSAIGKLTYGLP